jgi:hypothetical protein
MLLTVSPGRYLEPGSWRGAFRAGIVVEGLLVAAAFARREPLARLGRAWFPALLAVHFALGVWMVHASPYPEIDVVVVHREAINALLADEDPYRISFENIYGGDSALFYNPAAIVGNRVAFGYPYPPLSLLLAVPGQVLAGDYRYAEVAAFVGGAALIGYAQAALHARLAAVLLLTTPRGFFVLEQGWTEPIGVLMIALVVFLMLRRPSVVPWAGGLLVVTKQYFALAAPLLLRYAFGRGRRVLLFVTIAAFAGAAVTLPLALWHPNRFLDAVVWLQTREPFRADSLSFLSWAALHGWGAGSYRWAIGGALGALTIALWRTPNTAAGFAAGLAVSMMGMFVFGSKAFCNYYFVVIAAICTAIAAQPRDSRGSGSRLGLSVSRLDGVTTSI